MKKNINKAIELGKIWMKNSIDIAHNYEHASKVEEHALRIFEELNPKHVTKEELSLAAWWHDSYKSRCKKVTIASMWNEGPEARKIFEREMKDLVPPEYIKSVGRAIENHARVMRIFFRHTRFDSLSMILIEADQIDGLRKDRIEKGRKKMKNVFAYMADVILTDMVPMFLKMIHKSKYTEEILKLYYQNK